MSKSKEPTPMMKQFYSFKSQHPDALLLFRCGDFYETYGEDAIISSRILGITLTRRNNGGNTDVIEMAGFPFHAIDNYLPKLIRAGKRVAICDQLEDPKQAKGIVKRGITELVTPGIAMNDNVLTHKENNFLAAIALDKKENCGVAFLDISTGEFLTGEGTPQYIEKLLGSFMPKEVLYERYKKAEFEQHFGTKHCTFELDDWVFTEQTSRTKLLKHFGTTSLKGFGIEHLHNGIIAAGAIMQYLEQTQHTQLGHITAISLIEEEHFVRLDKFTIRSLELLSPMQEEGASLIDIIDRTTTAMGGRMLKRWVVFPLKSVTAIEQRLNIVEHYLNHPDFRSTIDDNLHRISDLERIISRVATSRVSPREMIQLRNALEALIPIKSACLESNNEALTQIGEQIALCDSLRERVSQEIQPDPPLVAGRGNTIAEGYSKKLDELRHISRDGRSYLLEIQQREIEATGIASLKVGYNNVFGYYLEVRNTYKELVPQEWIRKQTLAQAERYITQELKEYEDKILGADDKIQALEERLFNELVTWSADFIPQIQINANIIARLDCLLSFAKTSEEHHYTRPTIDESEVLDIKQGRHAVIETQLPIGESYIPNDILLDTESQQIIIITGPNMAGKSALLRQTALITLMAQIGSYVPAQSAHVGIVDKIFTRVGASDNISLGESTFMVEMMEASNILNNVTSRSLVLFDELGRGTSTYDGISIAWAIVEYLHQIKRASARTLFATHYHELNAMEATFPRIKNYNVSVKEVAGKIVFLRRLERGGSEHSFGIHVAEIAGMPKSIVNRAKEILTKLESTREQQESTREVLPQTNNANNSVQLSFFQLDDPVLSQIRDQLLQINVDNLTPVEALNKLNDIKKILNG